MPSIKIVLLAIITSHSRARWVPIARPFVRISSGGRKTSLRSSSFPDPFSGSTFRPSGTRPRRRTFPESRPRCFWSHLAEINIFPMRNLSPKITSNLSATVPIAQSGPTVWLAPRTSFAAGAPNLGKANYFLLTPLAARSVKFTQMNFWKWKYFDN